jgi:hypothetical protein
MRSLSSDSELSSPEKVVQVEQVDAEEKEGFKPMTWFEEQRQKKLEKKLIKLRGNLMETIVRQELNQCKILDYHQQMNRQIRDL